jgi:hypothetical protein
MLNLVENCVEPQEHGGHRNEMRVIPSNRKRPQQAGVASMFGRFPLKSRAGHGSKVELKRADARAAGFLPARLRRRTLSRNQILPAHPKILVKNAKLVGSLHTVNVTFRLKWPPKTGPFVKLWFCGSARHGVEQTNESKTQTV